MRLCSVFFGVAVPLLCDSIRFKPLKDDWCGTSKLQSYFCGTSKLLSHHVYPGSIGMLGRMVCILTT